MYGYVGNIPINSIDPSGLVCGTGVCVGVGIGIRVGWGAYRAWRGARLAQSLANSLPDNDDKTDTDTKSPNSDGGSCPPPDQDPKRNDPDQDAVVQLGKEAKKRGGVPSDQADILREWANKYGVNSRGPEAHPNRNFTKPHIHVNGMKIEVK